MTRITIPEKVEYILSVLHQNGYEAYVVGGCVRDSVLGRKPHDWDITASAAPEQVKALFHRTVDTGIAHGTVTVMLDKEGFEVTTYRVDGAYEDSRHPREVTFTTNLSEDLKRRDFTINAMAYSHETGLVDIFGGLEDLKSGIIRCVGSARERFGEDALRMMRAVRFAAQLGFVLDEETKEAIKAMAGALSKISAERVQSELVKLLVSPHPRWLEQAYECGITAVVLPEFDRIMAQRQNNSHHIYTTGVHTLVAMENIPPVRVLRLTMLFHDFGKPDVCVTDENDRDHFHGHAARSEIIARQVMRRLKFDNDTIRDVCILVKNHSRYPQPSGHDVRLTAYELGGREMFERFLLVRRADYLAHHPDVIEKKLNYLAEVKRVWEHVLAHGDCLSLKELALTGGDLVADGMKSGPQVGEVLQRLFEDVLEFPEHNVKDLLLEKSRKIREDMDKKAPAGSADGV